MGYPFLARICCQAEDGSAWGVLEYLRRAAGDYLIREALNQHERDKIEKHQQ